MRDIARYVPLTITYRNEHGESAVRRVIPHDFRWGTTAWHAEPQWLMRATDVEDEGQREFALRHCDFLGHAAPDARLAPHPLRAPSPDDGPA